MLNAIFCNVQCVMINCNEMYDAATLQSYPSMILQYLNKFKARIHIINDEFHPITLYGLHVVDTSRTATACAPMHSPAADRVFAVGRWHNNR